MTTKIAGTTGIEFPDSTDQATSIENGPIYIGTTNLSQSIPNNTLTKLDLVAPTQVRGFSFDATNDRIIPQRAGWYSVNFWVGPGNEPMTSFQQYVKKNGVNALGENTHAGGVAYITKGCSGLVYMNGTTDYLEMYVVFLPVDGLAMTFVDGGVRIHINFITGLIA